MEVLPTHTCFDDALEFLEDLARREEPFTHFRVVHALLKNPDSEVYAHAWLLNTANNTVVFAGIYDNEKIYIEADADEYYSKIDILDMTQYDSVEICEMNHLYGTYGPWKTQYLEYCRQGDSQHV